MLSVLRHLNYKAWFAMAEFVDNSIQSFLSHRDELARAYIACPTLRVSIEVDQADGGALRSGTMSQGYTRPTSHARSDRRRFRPIALGSPSSAWA